MGKLPRFAAIASLALIVVLGVVGCGGGSNQGQSGSAGGAQVTKLTESGSSLLYPLFNIWVPAYRKGHPNVRITTQSTGSGTGLSEAISGTIQIGASDAYMSKGSLKNAPSMLNIPLAISAQQIMYNLPSLGTQHLKLSGPVLAAIYTGSIKRWNNPQIAAINPGLKLPNVAILPVHRTDSSGDTFLFTQFLSFSTPSWRSKYSFGTAWPGVSGGIGAVGNEGVVQALKHTKGSIGYVGISWLAKAQAAGLGYAALQNKAGKFVLPTASTISAAASAKVASTPKDERLSLIYAGGASSYPIINYEYAIVNSHQSSAQVAKALTSFLNWAVSPSGGQSTSYLTKVNFLPLPNTIVKLSKDQIAKIK